MINAELKKILKSGILGFIIILIVALCVYAVIDFDNIFKYGSGGSGYGIHRYDNMEEVADLLEETDESIAEVEAELSSPTVSNSDNREHREYLEQLLSELKTESNIYRYILEKNISYEDYNDFAYVNAYKYDSAFSAATDIYRQVNYFLPFILALLSAVIMPLDFHTGTYRIIYSTSTPRKKVIASRYLTWLITAAVFTLLVCGAVAALSFMFGGAQGSVIFANLTSVFTMNYFGLCAFETVSILFRSLIVGSIIFAVSLFFKNAVVPVVVDVALCAAAYTAYFSEMPFLNVLLNGFVYAFKGAGASTIYILYVALIWLAAAAALLVFGSAWFIKRDLK